MFLLSFTSQSIAKTATKTPKTLTIATCEWAPYYGKKLESGGFFVDLTRQAFQRTGYKIEIKWVPWARALEMSYSGWYDILGGCYYSKERTKKLKFTDPVFSTKVAFFELQGRNIKFKKLTDLAKYNIGIVRGFANRPDFDAAYYLKKDEARNSKLNIGKLLLKRVDLIIESANVAQYILKKNYPNNIDDVTMITPVLQVKNLYLGVSKKNPNYKKIVADFNRGLKEIKKDGTYKNILEKHGFKE